MSYVNVVIDNNSRYTDDLYTYACDIPEVTYGSRVKVSFGQAKTLKEAYVFDVMEQLDKEVKGLKWVDSLLPSEPLDKATIELCKWMHSRYMCRYLDALKLFLPVGQAPKTSRKRDPFKGLKEDPQNIEQLTDEQAAAIKAAGSVMKEKHHAIFLLQGVTGSGKTEVYMRLIKQAQDSGKTALMLVPEISLTKQMVERFCGRFGRDNIAVFHSRLSQGERYHQWQRIKRGEATIVVGARSAIFTPLQNLGIVILDEEHESTYKSDMSPKYDTLEVAIKRVKPSGGMVLLGSATPSVVSRYRAAKGVYNLLQLKERYNKVALPEVVTVDLRGELKEGNTTMISRTLHQEMKKTLSAGEQVILFMNRRGYNNFVSCRECGYVVKCPTCDISLTYHKQEHAMVCHYCDHHEPLPRICPSCGSPYIKGFGVGTEQVEELVGKLFPSYPALRLDLDAMQRKGNTEKILREFGEGKSPILIGTQVVAKGLDFRNVGLVGVVSCDVMLNIPDYRSPERAFQLITQAAGRAGRGDKKGRVIIQTYTPDHYAIKAAAAQDYEAFYQEEIARREMLKYPPFADIIQVVFSGKDLQVLGLATAEWKDTLLATGVNPAQLVDAGTATYNRAEKEHRACLLIKALPGEKTGYMKQLAILRERDRLAHKEFGVVVDVNPYTLWRS